MKALVKKKIKKGRYPWFYGVIIHYGDLKLEHWKKNMDITTLKKETNEK